MSADAPRRKRAAAANEQEERSPEDDRQPGCAGEPEQEAGEDLPGVEDQPGARRSVRPGVRVGLSGRRHRIARQGDTDREQGQPDRHDVGQVPGRPELRGVPQDRAQAEEERARDPDPAVDPEAPEHPERDRHVERPEDRGDELCVRGQTPDRDERHEHDSRQRRERQERVLAGLAVRPERRDDVLEQVVPADPGLVVDGVADGRPPVEECLRLPDEVVVVARPVGVAGDIDDQQQGRDGEADGDRRIGPGPGPDEAVRRGVRRRALRYTPLHLSARAGGGPPWQPPLPVCPTEAPQRRRGRSRPP